MDNSKTPNAEELADLKGKLYPEVKLYFSNGKRFLGPGRYALLVMVQKTGSLRNACFEIGISYSKGLKIIKTAEAQLGFPVVRKKRGGASGGATVLTENGERLLTLYESFTKESQQLVLDAFEKCFDQLFGGKD